MTLVVAAEGTRARGAQPHPASPAPPLVRGPDRTTGPAVRRVGIRAQLAAFSFILVLVAAGGAAVVSWRILDRQVQQATTERLNAASTTFNSLYQQRVSDADLVTRQLSDRTQIVALIRQRNSEQLTALIEPIQTLRPFYSIVVGDRNGDVLAKVIPPGRADPGPSLLDVPGATEALEVDAAYPVLVRRQDCQMIVAVSVPVKAVNGVTVGLLHLRFPIDDDFVRQVKRDTSLDVALYCGDTLLATTLPGQATAIGSKVASGIADHVLDGGLEWEENLDLPSQTFRVRYVPLLGSDGKPLGMYGVAIPVQTLRDARSALLRVFVPVIAGIAALGMLFGYLGSAVLTRPLRRLAAAAARIGSGDLDSPVPIHGEDEVAQLAERMEEMRRSLAETYAQLRELNQLKDEYLFSVAHEVRTPLSSLVASVEILAGDYDEMSPGEMNATIRRIERSAVRLQTLVENVLDAGSIRAGRFSIHPSPVPLPHVLEVAAATLQPLLDEKRQRLDVSVPETLPAVLADERRLVQVFSNLISNASKYGPQRDLIAVQVTVQADDALVRVSDHGPGIPLPEQGELFERYFRAADAARSSPGTGLGLAISKAIVEAHGGSVGLESDPGRGTTVWFTLPFAAPARTPAAREAIAL